MTDFLEKIPTKWLILFAAAFLLFISVVVGYAVLFQNKSVDFFGLIKVGESLDDLRQQLDKAKAEINSRVPREEYNALIAKLKQTESKSSQGTSDVNVLKVQFKQREDTITQITKEIEETKLALATAKRELQSARDQAQRIAAELDELKKKQVGSIPQKKIQAFIQQLVSLEKEAPSMDGYNQTALVTSYNNMLKSLKKDLPNDTYIQGASELSPSSSWSYLGPALKLFSAQLKNYLEQTYLK